MLFTLRRAALAAAVFSLLTQVALAQVTTGTILGTVTDSTGAAVAGATVIITEVSKNTTTRTQSDQDGGYNVPFLVPGVYSVAVEK